MILSLGILSCSNNASHVEGDKKEHEHHDTAKTSIALQLNNGSKWKADEATRKNVAALVTVINDTGNMKNKSVMVKNVQAGVDSLVQQCRMQGPDHDALHVWLEKVLKDIKELKENEDNEFPEAHAVLKKDVESFYSFFE